MGQQFRRYGTRVGLISDGTEIPGKVRVLRNISPYSATGRPLADFRFELRELLIFPILSEVSLIDFAKYVVGEQTTIAASFLLFRRIRQRPEFLDPNVFCFCRRNEDCQHHGAKNDHQQQTTNQVTYERRDVVAKYRGQRVLD
jgi:hypothetical protein